MVTQHEIWNHVKRVYPDLNRNIDPDRNERVFFQWFRMARDNENRSYSQRAAMRRRLKRFSGGGDPLFEAEWYKLTQYNDELNDNPEYYRAMLRVVMDTTRRFSREERKYANTELSDAVGFNVWEDSQPWVDYK